jgi:hypothetical protein
MGSAAQVLKDLSNRGIEIVVDGRKLRFRPRSDVTPELLEALKANRAEIIAHLQERNGGSGNGSPLSPEKTTLLLPPASKDTDMTTDFGPAPLPSRMPSVEQIQHKDPDCRSVRSWHHRWGSWHCEDCWTCTEERFLVERWDCRPPEQVTPPANCETAQTVGASPAARTATASEQKSAAVWDADTAALIDWYRTHRDQLPAEPFQLGPRRVIDPQLFYRSIDRDIQAGPKGPSARHGTLGIRLQQLKEKITAVDGDRS